MAASLPDASRLNGDFLVILRAAGGERATKRLFRVPGGFGVDASPKVTDWRWERVPVGGLDDIEEVLSRVASESAACVIGDDIREGAGPVIARRIEDEGADLNERGRRWLAFDCDGWTPPGWPLSATPTDADIRAAVRALVDTLPGLEGVECVYRLSATAGLVKRGDGVRVPGWASLRCHVWVWLDRAVFPPSVKAWFKVHFPDGPKGSPGWDGGMMDRARVHYVASPVIEGGDVVAVSRIGRIPGRAATAPAQWQSLEDWRESEARALADARARLAALKLEQAGRPRDGDDIQASIRRILAARVAANISGPATAKMKPVCNASEPGSDTAHRGAVRALTNATALETLGEVGAVRDCEDMLRGALLSLGKSRGAAQAADRCIRRALLKVNPGAVAASIEGARRAYEPKAHPAAASRGRLTGTPANDPLPVVTALDPLPDNVLGLHREIHGRLSRRWPAELVREHGFGVLEDAALMGGRVILLDEGDPCRVYLRRIAARAGGRRLLRRAGLIDADGRPWGPLAKGAKLTPILPVYGPEGASPRGWATLSGDTCGERWPVGLRWPADHTLGAARSVRPLVLVSAVLDAVALGPLAYGLPGDDIARALDVVAIGETWRPEWGEVLEGRRCVVLAPLPGDTWAGDVVAAARAADVPLTMAGWPRGSLAKTWAELDARAVVKRWRQKAREVSDGR